MSALWVDHGRTKMKELVRLIFTCGQLSFGERKLSWLDGLHYFCISEIWIYV